MKKEFDENDEKYQLILQTLEELLKTKNLKSITVNEIAQKAGIAKGSVYYYFESKNAIYEALIQRSYKRSIETAKRLVEQTNVSPFDRMASIFFSCKQSSMNFLGKDQEFGIPNPHEQAYLYQEFSKYIISELTPVLTEIIEQAIEQKIIEFEHPAQLAEISLIFLTAKMNPNYLPATAEDVEETMRGFIELMEKGTHAPKGAMDYMMYHP